MKKILIYLLLLLTTAIAAFAASAEGAWSEAVNGIRGRLVLGQDPDFNGAQMLVVYLELQNVSDVASPRRVRISPGGQFQWDLRDATGVPIPESPFSASIMVPRPYWITLPHDSTLRFRVSVTGYSIGPGGFVLQLNKFWHIQRKEGAQYFLSGTFTSTVPQEEVSKETWQGEFWRGTLVFSRVEIPKREEPNQPVQENAGKGSFPAPESDTRRP